MQTFSCSSLSSGKTTLLKDIRDNNVYTVFKGEDGNCWMSQNLRLIDKTITPADSNVISNFTVPNNNWSSSLDPTDKYTNAYTYQTGNTDYGVYYNYAAATAGTISGTSNTTEATYDICPKGWRLPTHTEQAALLSAYGVTDDAAGSTIMRSEPLNFVFSGNIDYNKTSPDSQGANGRWWSSTASNGTARYRIYINSSSAFDTGYSNRRLGIFVRCIAEVRTIKNTTYMQDITPDIVANTAEGTTATLTDKRDNNTYTVFKGKDGNVWMSQNLRLIGSRTLTSSDSNVSSNFALPASISSWTSSYDSAMVYDTGDSSDGVYYNYAAASAGTITGNSNKTAASYDVCPKSWRLPTSAEFSSLRTAYGVSSDAAGSTTLRSAPLNFVYSGKHDKSGTTVDSHGTQGFWWSSTSADATNRLGLNLYDFDAYVAYGQRRIGYSIRCVAK